MLQALARSLGTLALMATVAGCAAASGQESEGPPPSVESSGVQVACITPCLIQYEVRLPASVTNGTYRSNAEVQTLVLDAVRATLATRVDIDVDEGSDPTTRANALSLTLAVPSLTASNGVISAKVRMNIFRFSSGALLGTIEKVVSVRSAPGNHAAEDLAISTAATKATETLIANLGSF